MSKWIFSAADAKEKTKCCACASITTLTYRDDLAQLKANLFEQFENKLHIAHTFSNKLAVTMTFDNYLASASKTKSIKQQQKPEEAAMIQDFRVRSELVTACTLSHASHVDDSKNSTAKNFISEN